jgi:hypothetical protein
MEAVAHNKAFAKKIGVPQSVGEDFSNADKGKTFKRGGQMKHESKAKEMKEAKELRHIADEEEKEAHEMKRGGHVKKMAHGGHAKSHTKKMAMGGPGIDPRVAALMMAAQRRRGATSQPTMAPPPATMGMKHGGLSKVHHKHLAEHHLSMAEHHMAQHEAHGGRVKKMAKGGIAESMGPRNMHGDVEAGSNKHLKHGESAVQKRGHTRGQNLGDSGKVSKVENEGDMKSWEKEGMKKGGHVKKYAKGGHVSSEAHHRGDGIAKRGHTKTKFC